MNLKIGAVELQPWKWHIYFGGQTGGQTVSGWYREDGFEYSEEICGSVALYATDVPNVWELKFWHNLEFLNKIYGTNLLIGNENEIKDKIDKFLIRITSLLPFI